VLEKAILEPKISLGLRPRAAFDAATWRPVPYWFPRWSVRRFKTPEMEILSAGLPCLASMDGNR
jgi:hypothetical protein